MSLHVTSEQYAGIWRAGNDGTGPRRWFVYCGEGAHTQFHTSRNGTLARYGSSQAAQAIADFLNSELVSA